MCTPKTGMGFPGSSVSKQSACNAGDPGSIPGLGRSPGEGNGKLLHCSCLEYPVDRGAWWATVHTGIITGINVGYMKQLICFVIFRKLSAGPVIVLSNSEISQLPIYVRTMCDLFSQMKEISLPCNVMIS